MDAPRSTRARGLPEDHTSKATAKPSTSTRVSLSRPNCNNLNNVNTMMATEIAELRAQLEADRKLREADLDIGKQLRSENEHLKSTLNDVKKQLEQIKDRMDKMAEASSKREEQLRQDAIARAEIEMEPTHEGGDAVVELEATNSFTDLAWKGRRGHKAQTPIFGQTPKQQQRQRTFEISSGQPVAQQQNAGQCQQQRHPKSEMLRGRGLGRKRPDVIVVAPAVTPEKTYTYREVYERLQHSSLQDADKAKVRRGYRTRNDELKLTLSRDTDAGTLLVRVQEALGDCGTARLVTEMSEVLLKHVDMLATEEDVRKALCFVMETEVITCTVTIWEQRDGLQRARVRLPRGAAEHIIGRQLKIQHFEESTIKESDHLFDKRLEIHHRMDAAGMTRDILPDDDDGIIMAEVWMMLLRSGMVI
uniref:Uncharacterized protein n=1 Tax=Anopheles epiroticus TaxID=199890 RepID=A0A182PWC5_9DIPT